jgi:hypothetical protein
LCTKDRQFEREVFMQQKHNALLRGVGCKHGLEGSLHLIWPPINTTVTTIVNSTTVTTNTTATITDTTCDPGTVGEKERCFPCVLEHQRCLLVEVVFA